MQCIVYIYAMELGQMNGDGGCDEGDSASNGPGTHHKYYYVYVIFGPAFGTAPRLMYRAIKQYLLPGFVINKTVNERSSRCGNQPPRLLVYAMRPVCGACAGGRRRRCVRYEMGERMKH